MSIIIFFSDINAEHCWGINLEQHDQETDGKIGDLEALVPI